jgi:hypothetical protein
VNAKTTVDAIFAGCAFMLVPASRLAPCATVRSGFRRTSAAPAQQAPDALRAPGETRRAGQIPLDPAAVPERLRLAGRLEARRRPAAEHHRARTAVLPQWRRENRQHALDRVAAPALAPPVIASNSSARQSGPGAVRRPGWQAGPMESVWDYPRPPRLERSAARVTVVHAGQVIVDSDRC